MRESAKLDLERCKYVCCGPTRLRHYPSWQMFMFVLASAQMAVSLFQDMHISVCVAFAS